MVFVFKIIGLYFLINYRNKLHNSRKYWIFLIKKLLLRIAPSFPKVRESRVCEGTGVRLLNANVATLCQSFNYSSCYDLWQR